MNRWWFSGACLVLLNVILSATPSIAILTTPAESQQFPQTLQRSINQLSSADLYSIKNTYDIGKVLSRSPALVILSSSVTSERYIRYRPQSNTAPLTLALSTPSSYERIANALPRATVLRHTIDIELLMEQLVRFTGNIAPRVGYLYPKSHTAQAIYESERLQNAGITLFAKELQPETSEEQIIRDLQQLTAQGTTVLRLCGTDPLETIVHSRKILQRITSQFSVVITDRGDLYTALPGIAVVTIQDTPELTQAALTLIATTINHTGEPLPNYVLKTFRATLHYGSTDHFALVAPSPFLSERLTTGIETVRASTSRSAAHATAKELLSPLGDTTSHSTGGSFDISRIDPELPFLDQPLLYGFLVSDLILLIGAAGGMGILLILVSRRRKRQLHTIPTAFIVPPKLLNRTLRNPGGRNKRMVSYLKKERFRLLPIKKIMTYQRALAISADRLHILDWKTDQECVIFLYRALQEKHHPYTDTVVVCNIPYANQLEIAPRFGETSLHLYEHLPSVEEMDTVLYGSGQQEKQVSYISGALSEGILPPVLQLLDTNNVTGALLIEDPSPFAALFYEKGAIVYAENRLGHSGEQALYDVLGKNEGSFRFEPDRQTPRKPLSLRSMDILMGWAAYSEQGTV